MTSAVGASGWLKDAILHGQQAPGNYVLRLFR